MGQIDATVAPGGQKAKKRGRIADDKMLAKVLSPLPSCQGKSLVSTDYSFATTPPTSTSGFDMGHTRGEENMFWLSAQVHHYECVK